MFCSKCGNQVGPNAKFCNKCGNQLYVQSINQNAQNIPSHTLNTLNNSNNYNQNSNIQKFDALGSQNNNYQHNYSSNNSKKMLFIGIGAGLGVFLILLLIINLSIGSSGNYFFDTNSGVPTDEVTQNSGTQSKKNKYSTAIIHDNTYSGIKIDKAADALELIVNDSVSQKKNCPSEIRQIEDDIINKYGLTAVNLCEMELGFAKEIGNVFKKIYAEYPSARGYITNLTLANVSMSESYIAAFMPLFNFVQSDSASTYQLVFKTQIILNTAYFLNAERLQNAVTSSSKSGHFPKNATRYSPVAHELGHYLSFLAMMKHYKSNSVLLVNGNNIDTIYALVDDFVKGNHSLTMIREAYERYKKDTDNPMSLDEWRGTISRYALAKDNNGEYIYDETIAESFHDVYLNGDNASEASKYVISILKEKLEG